MQTLKAGLAYFGMVFGAGFVLGPVRELLLVPRLGARTAELIEMPIMLAVIIYSARWVTRSFSVPPTWTARLGMGCLALGFLLLAEFSLVLWLRGMTIAEYFAARDLVSGTVYYLMLGVFAITPGLVRSK